MFLPPAKSILLIRTDFQNKHIWLYLLRLLGLPDINGSFIKLNITVDTSIKEDGILKFFCKTKRGQYLNGGRFLDKLWKGLKPWIKLCMLTQRHVAKVCGLCVTLHVVSQNSLLTKNLKIIETIWDDGRHLTRFFAPLLILKWNPFLPGLCPQENIIFDYLNPREHLTVFAGIKGVHSRSQIKHMVTRT